jgi:aminocarboxymuconate-semialdehyde decarboxylase
MPAPLTIDFHAHAQSPKVIEIIAGAPGAPIFENTPHNRHLAETRYRPAMTDITVRLQAMDQQRVDMQVVSPAPNDTAFGYWADQDVSGRIVAAANEHVAEVCALRPDRLIGLGGVSLQFPEIAAAQLRSAMTTLDLRGAEISTRAGDLEFDDPRLDPFWEAAQELGAVLFIHPPGNTLAGRLARYYLINLIGNPLDTTIAVTHLIFGGVLERFPRLKIVVAHGGGYLPSYFSRSEHGYAVRPELQTIPKPPREYLHRIWIDNLVFNPENLTHLIEVMGASRIVLGTDYPFDMGQENPVDLVDAVPSLSEQQAALIKGGNAAELLGLR